MWGTRKSSVYKWTHMNCAERIFKGKAASILVLYGFPYSGYKNPRPRSRRLISGSHWRFSLFVTLAGLECTM